jgi:hypothetical protein
LSATLLIQRASLVWFVILLCHIISPMVNKKAGLVIFNHPQTHSSAGVNMQILPDYPVARSLSLLVTPRSHSIIFFSFI